MEQNKQTTLVTGGAGFIGSHLVDILLEQGDRVVCLDNFSDYYSPERKRQNVSEHLKHPNYTLVEGDIRDRDGVMSLFDEHQPNRVANLAAMAGVRYSIERASLYVDVNLQGTINLMDAARKHDTSQFVQASTSSIYGKTTDTPFFETHSTDLPLAPYPASKKAAEVMGNAYHNMFGLNFTALRFFTVYGPRVRSDMMAYTVMDSILNDKPITLYNGGEMHRDWTFVKDIAQGIALTLDKPLGYEIMNIGRGEPVHLGEFVNIIEGLLGKKAIIESVPAPVSEPSITFASVDKMRELVGYSPSVSIREGLSQTWDWYRETHLT